MIDAMIFLLAPPAAVFAYVGHDLRRQRIRHSAATPAAVGPPTLVEPLQAESPQPALALVARKAA
jgi:hypothetical protein